MNNFSIQKLWNDKVSVQQNRTKVRDYISPSDLGGSFLDRYYKMTGVEPTNKYEERTLRIFDAGRLFEWIILRVFAMSGILLERQFKITIPETKDTLAVWGYGDAIIGGTPNWNDARNRVNKFLDEFKLKIDDEVIERYSIKLIDGLEKEYPNGLPDKIIVEAKSINSMAFWGHNNRNKDNNFIGYDHHKLQAYAYLKGRPDASHARLFYISKDDLCLQEVGVFQNEGLEEKYMKDIKEMTHYIKAKEEPKREEDIVYDEKKKLFTLNWRIARSTFLTKITGLENVDAWQEKFRPEMQVRNLALKHLKIGKIKKEDESLIEKFDLKKYL